MLKGLCKFVLFCSAGACQSSLELDYAFESAEPETTRKEPRLEPEPRNDAGSADAGGPLPEQPVPSEPAACFAPETRSCGLPGSCSDGVQSCGTDGLWSECSVLPAQEDTCEPLNDANCNGIPNEGCVCSPGEPRSCPDALGSCATGTQTCGQNGQWSECDVTPAPSDTCIAGDDSSCDGTPNQDCTCLYGQQRVCPELGNCGDGTQTCGSDGEWEPCTEQRADQDSCSTPGDDADCDGIANGNCDCTDGQTQLCGPRTEAGVCVRGVSTCTAGVWGVCVGAIGPSARDCRFAVDNDCDGTPDNASDTCQCIPDATEDCDQHPGLDNVGICHSGTRRCIASNDFGASSWGACVDSRGPLSRNCSSSLDNDCDGRTDNLLDGVCQCAVGATESCGEQAGSRGCRTGTRTCISPIDRSTTSWGSCVFTSEPDGTLCDDGDPATIRDACRAGTCLGVPEHATLTLRVTEAQPSRCSILPSALMTITMTAKPYEIVARPGGLGPRVEGGVSGERAAVRLNDASWDRLCNCLSRTPFDLVIEHDADGAITAFACST